MKLATNRCSRNQYSAACDLSFMREYIFLEGTLRVTGLNPQMCRVLIRPIFIVFSIDLMATH